jgi:hypothetical protein
MWESATRQQTANGNQLLTRMGHSSNVSHETGIGVMQSSSQKGVHLAVDEKVAEQR